MNSFKNFLTSIRSWVTRNTVLFVQKWVSQYTVSLLGDDQNFWRKGFIELNSNILFQVKTPQDIIRASTLFPDRNKFLVTGTDVLKKWEINGSFDDTIIENISSKNVWWCESTLSVFGQMNSLEKMIEEDLPPDIIYTRGTPTLTELAIRKSYPKLNIEIYEVDGNTEAYVALAARENPNKVICGTEFVQSGKSLRETQSYILGPQGIYEPTRWVDGNFSLQMRNSSSLRAKSFAEALTLEVNIIFARIFTNK